MQPESSFLSLSPSFSAPVAPSPVASFSPSFSPPLARFTPSAILASSSSSRSAAATATVTAAAAASAGCARERAFAVLKLDRNSAGGEEGGGGGGGDWLAMKLRDWLNLFYVSISMSLSGMHTPHAAEVGVGGGRGWGVGGGRGRKGDHRVRRRDVEYLREWRGTGVPDGKDIRLRWWIRVLANWDLDELKVPEGEMHALSGDSIIYSRSCRKNFANYAYGWNRSTSRLCSPSAHDFWMLLSLQLWISLLLVIVLQFIRWFLHGDSGTLWHVWSLWCIDLAYLCDDSRNMNM